MGINLGMDSAVIDLPQPVSPTKPKNSPRRSFKLTPAKTFDTPSKVLNSKCKSRISKRLSFFICYLRDLGSSTSRNPSPNKFQQKTISQIAIPGKVDIHQLSGK